MFLGAFTTLEILLAIVCTPPKLGHLVMQMCVAQMS